MSRFAGFDPQIRLRSGGGRPSPDRRHWVIRPLDLLVLGFDLVGLRVVPGEGEGPARLDKDGRGEARLVVWFPPQHLTERAYYTTKDPDGKDMEPPTEVLNEKGEPVTPEPAIGDESPDDPPIDAIVAGWSRLVFRVGDDRLPIDWTLEGLLAAMGALELSVPANALPPKKPGWLLGSLLERGAFGTDVVIASQTGAIGSAFTEAGAEAAAAEVVGSVTARLIAGSRAKRKARTIGNALGLTTLTGSATRELIGDQLLAPRIPPILLRPEPAPPTAAQTALEVPYRLILSPNRFGAWFHRNEPATSERTGHTELWHTRLGARHEDGTLIDGDDPLRTLRAVWALDPPMPSRLLGIPTHNTDPWRMSLDAFDRHNVMHLSSNFRLEDGNVDGRPYEPNALDVRLFALSSLGAWMDTRGAWPPTQPTGLAVEEWRHLATLGRDHYVRVVYAGFLYPFGHRASVIKITERQFHGDRDGNPAYLRQRMFLAVREPVRTYRGSRLLYDGPDAERLKERYDLMMPFEAVRVLTLVSPLLDPPENDDVADRQQAAFWPCVGGQPFRFHLTATDTDDNPVDLAMPLIFVGKDEADFDYEDSIVPDASPLTDEKIQAEYETATWPGTGGKRATVPLGGQKVALAESAEPDDTAFAVQSLTFGGEVPAQAKYDALGPKVVRFFPVVRKAMVDVPSLQRIAKTKQAADVVYPHDYLVAGFDAAANPGQVFLGANPGADEKLGVEFSAQGDRSGGLVTPDLDLSGVSRLSGPIAGDISIATKGTFDPKSWFGALTGAKLFGVLSLSDILDGAGFDELDKLPQLTGQALNQVEQLIAGLERLRSLADATATPETAVLSSALDQLLDEANGSIPALLAGDPPGVVVSQLAVVAGELDALPAALAGSAAAPGPAAAISQTAAGLKQRIEAVVDDAKLLTDFAAGDVLPQALSARFDWRPALTDFGPFVANGDKRNLLLSVEAADALGDSDEAFTVTCSLDDFILDLEVVILKFERVQLQAVAGRKMDVDVRFDEFVFAGPLAFVETLRELIPFNGFSDPPDVQVTPNGITAGFTTGLPNLSVGVFSLENLSLGAGFDVPFVGKPLSTWFAFCTRENPSRLTVSLFGGGFYLGLTVDAKGLQVFEGAIEFGAACSVDFGVASGSVSAMAGLYFKIEGSDFTLAGYFRLRGEVEALGIVSVSIELYLEMRYESATEKCVGTATLSIEVDVALFSTTIEISCTKKFAGSGKDPTLAEAFDVQPDATSAPWNEYCGAFG